MKTKLIIANKGVMTAYLYFPTPSIKHQASPHLTGWLCLSLLPSPPTWRRCCWRVSTCSGCPPRGGRCGSYRRSSHTGTAAAGRCSRTRPARGWSPCCTPRTQRAAGCAPRGMSQPGEHRTRKVTAWGAQEHREWYDLRSMKCLFIRVSGHVDCGGHFAPVLQSGVTYRGITGSAWGARAQGTSTNQSREHVRRMTWRATWHVFQGPSTINGA